MNLSRDQITVGFQAGSIERKQDILIAVYFIWKFNSYFTANSDFSWPRYTKTLQNYYKNFFFESNQRSKRFRFCLSTGKELIFEFST